MLLLLIGRASRRVGGGCKKMCVFFFSLFSAECAEKVKVDFSDRCLLPPLLCLVTNRRPIISLSLSLVWILSLIFLSYFFPTFSVRIQAWSWNVSRWIQLQLSGWVCRCVGAVQNSHRFQIHTFLLCRFHSAVARLEPTFNGTAVEQSFEEKR